MANPNIHIVGIQGSGKGTQSALLTQKYGFSYVASGDLFRKRTSIDDDFGRSLKHDLASGSLISDTILSEVIENYLQTTVITRGLLGDGVIRTTPQVALYAPLWKRYDLEEPYLVFMDLNESVAFQRIQNRVREHMEHGGEARADDTPEAIKRRFAQFHSLTEPVVTTFENAGRCIRIPADTDVVTIHVAICKALETIYPDLGHVSH